MKRKKKFFFLSKKPNKKEIASKLYTNRRKENLKFLRRGSGTEKLLCKPNVTETPKGSKLYMTRKLRRSMLRSNSELTMRLRCTRLIKIVSTKLGSSVRRHSVRLTRNRTDSSRSDSRRKWRKKLQNLRLKSWRRSNLLRSKRLRKLKLKLSDSYKLRLKRLRRGRRLKLSSSTRLRC